MIHKRVRLFVFLVLALLSLGCGALTSMAPTQTPATPREEPPTATVLALTPTVQDEPPVPAGLLSDLQTEVQAVYQSVGKSVVNISVVTISYDFFTNPVPQEGAGSGFVYDEEGHVVTNYHVVAEADSIQVFFADGTSTAAEVVGSDPTYDLAVLELEDADEFDLDPIPIGDSDQLVVGEFVVAVGSPFGLEQSLTFGVISSLGRIIESPNGRYIGEAIQTDAAINPGNSGGPLLDLKGRIIGVNAQIVSPSRASAGIGFAIPANIVRRVVPELITLGRYRHPWMGIRYFPYALTPRLAKQFRELDVEVPDHGLLILDVEPGSPADESGLQGGDRVVTLQNVELPVGGDVIIAVDGESIDRAQDLIAYLETETQIGDTIQVTIIRDGEEMTLPLTLGERPSS